MKKNFSWKDRANSFIPAWNGARYAILHEHNLRLMLCVGALVILLSAVIGISGTEWAIILICVGTVLAAEIFNSSIEQLVNLTEPNQNPIAGRVKDLSAGAVLVLCITSAIVAAIVLIPRLYQICAHLR